jgi:hypothetical protein
MLKHLDCSVIARYIQLLAGTCYCALLASVRVNVQRVRQIEVQSMIGSHFLSSFWLGFVQEYHHACANIDELSKTNKKKEKKIKNGKKNR